MKKGFDPEVIEDAGDDGETDSEGEVESIYEYGEEGLGRRDKGAAPRGDSA